MTPLAIDLARRGIASWNLEYHRVGQEGGGWPGTFEDVATAIDHLIDLDVVDHTRVVTCGHSAGGHLALWLAARPRLPRAALRGVPRLAPVAAVALAGVCDLVSAWRENAGDGAVRDLLGSYDDDPERYEVASPAALAPLGVPQLLVHGIADEIVPLAQSREYAARDPQVELVEVDGADHFDVIDPSQEAWAAVVARLPALMGVDVRAR